MNNSNPRPSGRAGDEQGKEVVKESLELLDVCEDGEGQTGEDEEHVGEEHAKEVIESKGKERRDIKHVHWKDR